MNEPRPGDRPHASLPLGAIHLLLVEDDEMLRIAMEGFLRAAGAEVASVPNAEAAAATLAAGLRPEVLLTDLQLPVRSGLWLAEWCAESHPELAVILMSAALPPNGVVFPAQVRRFLGKPFDLNTLTDAVARAAGR